MDLENNMVIGQSYEDYLNRVKTKEDYAYKANVFYYKLCALGSKIEKLEEQININYKRP